MPDTGFEARLSALFALADAAFAGEVWRNIAVSVDIPGQGLLIQWDGEPGAPTMLMSPLAYEYDHAVEWELHVQGKDDDARRQVADPALQSLGAAVAADRTLGGLCDWVEAERVRTDVTPVQGGAAIRTDTLRVTLTYSLSTPLT
ncbi:acyl-CoA transferase [Citreimonas sp.]|uniref:acyl-CoA transferase n=1 Tax=Citreimonas sp. TaxID=3036715 RepID=UPI004059174F